MRIISLIIITSVLITFHTGCYSFKGISIEPGTNTFYVAPFDNSAPNALPTLPLTYTNLLIDKIRNESPLEPNEEEPDIEFRGTITGFRVTSEAPVSEQDIAFNRLTIRVLIEYINNRDETKNWSTNFNHFNDFGADENLIDVQEQLIISIGDQLMEDIFNKAFTDW